MKTEELTPPSRTINLMSPRDEIAEIKEKENLAPHFGIILITLNSGLRLGEVLGFNRPRSEEIKYCKIT